MKWTASRFLVAAFLASLAVSAAFAQGKPKPKYTAAPGADLKQPIIWGSECVLPDGTGLRFGGHDQKADDGAARTAIRVDGQWKDISEELRKANPDTWLHQNLIASANFIGKLLAANRYNFFENREAYPQATTSPDYVGANSVGTYYVDRMREKAADGPAKSLVIERMRAAGKLLDPLKEKRLLAADELAASRQAQVLVQQAAELLDCEPAPRALSPIAYDAKTKLFVIFGGDHLDYMTNDTWVFDPAKKRWEMRHPKTAPPPRANHTLAAAGDGKIKLSGGITHNNTDIWYMGPLYQFVDDGDWVYDVEANTWTSESGKEGVEPNQRAYRTLDFFLPEGFMKGEKPDAAANEAKLKALPANTWVAMNPPVKPRVNRDWGSACIAPDHDVLLRWSGGHSAHGGSDVPMYHFATNRWELTFPVEFPLGQCYSNTSYPTGFNFNRRPWVSGHTYKNFGYDPVGKVMVFTGHNPWSYLFDAKVGDWIGRTEKPAAMNYGGSFYTLTLCTTDKDLYAWGGQYGRSIALHKWNSQAKTWEPVNVAGAKLPGPAVDHSGLAYDAKRDRLIFFPKKYEGTLFAMDCKTNELSEFRPGGANEAAATVSFWRELAYVPDADAIVVVGASVPAVAVAEDGPAGDAKNDPKRVEPRDTLVYDCAANAWKTIQIGGPHPAGKGGRDVSCGSCYDPRRKLIWATDTNGQVYALRFEVK